LQLKLGQIKMNTEI